jgi:hypothetical protein
MKPPEDKHDYYLSELIRNLYQIEEDPRQIKWIMKDGIWLPERGNTKRGSLCDLILVYHDGFGVPIELKGSMEKKQKAKDQLDWSRRFIIDELHLPVPYGKFVCYKKGCAYHVEKFEYR